MGRRGRVWPALGLVVLAVVAVAAGHAATAPLTVTITAARAGPMANGFAMPLGDVTPLDVATFSFAASGAVRSFSCSLDGADPTACASPRRYDHLAPGPHSFSVTAANGDVKSDPATVAWRIAAVPGRAVNADPRPERLLGPKLFRPSQLLASNARLRVTSSSEKEGDDLESVAPIVERGAGNCAVVTCQLPPEGGGTALRAASALGKSTGSPTPPLTSGPYFLGGQIDPQIAASNEFLVVTLYDKIWFFYKDGQLVKTDKNGNTIQNPVDTMGFWRDSWFNPKNPPTLNDSLNLPSGMQCSTTIDPFDGDPKTPGDQPLTAAQKLLIRDCYKRVYDTRVVFDDFRKRFWIISAVRNDPSEYDTQEDVLKLPVAERVGIRDTFVVAVSKTQDPRDGWYQYAWDTVYDVGACNDVGPGPPTLPAPPLCPGTNYRPGDHSDYPSLGISKDYVVTTIPVAESNPFDETKPYFEGYGYYTSVVAFQADGLANGNCASPCGWNYGRFTSAFVSNGQTVVPTDVLASDYGPGGPLAAAVQHDFESGWTMLVGNSAQYAAVVIVGFRPPDQQHLFAPPLQITWVPVKETAAVHDMPQGPANANPPPPPVVIHNLANYALRAAARDGELDVVWQDCPNWPGVSGECTTSIHLLGVTATAALAGSCACVTHDRVFGLRSEKDDPAGSVVYYGNPSVEINKNDHVVVVYNRSGLDVPFQARYSAFLKGEPDIRPSAVLDKGSFPAAGNKMDTSGIGVDPFDGEGVWMVAGTTSSNGLRYAFGKVFGGVYPDISIDFGKLLASKTKLMLKLSVGDVGDGASSGIQGQAVLVSPKGRRIPLGRFTTGRLAPTRKVALGLTVRRPKTLPSGTYQLVVTVRSHDREYGGPTHVLRRAVPIR